MRFQALTYRVGHHSTSDDSTKYRPVDEIEHWRTARDPISRYRKWVQGNDWWSDAEESELRSRVRKEVLHQRFIFPAHLRYIVIHDI
jgi:2-oxoisovalerate dehydrogenase E1 component alpha subunit